MARVKVKLADNIARVVFIESDATKGATVGVDLMLNGRVATPAALSQWLNSGSGSGGQSTLLHSTLAGLQQGDDHPQYTMWQAAERITGQWVFERQVRVDPGTAALPSVGFINDVDTGVYSPAVGVVGISANGTETFRFGAGGQLGIRGDFGTQDQALLSQGPGDSPEWTTLAPVALSNDYDDLDNKPAIPPDLSALNFITSTDETSALVNSRRLVAGPNITIDATTPGQLVIDAVSGGTGTVTSVGTGTGLTGGPITSSGTIALDSASIASLSLADSAIQPGDYDAVTFLSSSDETATFPASRRLVAGTNITFNTSTPGQLVINASGGGGGGGQVDSIGAGTGITVDSTNPVIPVVAVDTSANFTWTGNHQFDNTVLIDGSGASKLVLQRTGLAANTGRWRQQITAAGNYTMLTEADNGGAGGTAFQFTRSGNTVQTVEFSTAGGEGFRVNPSAQLLVNTTTIDGANYAMQIGDGSALSRLLVRVNDNRIVGLRRAAGETVFIGAETNGQFVIYGGAGTQVLGILRDGRLYGSGLHNNANSVAGATNQYIASGTYTPTLSSTGGISGASVDGAVWTRVGNVVTVAGSFFATVTSAGGSARISLPIPSTLANGRIGGAIGSEINSPSVMGGAVKFTSAAATVAYAQWNWSGSTPSSTTFVFHFSYVVV